jgi:triosephosphate isomerase
MPKNYIIGNWKMNLSLNTIHEFFSGLTPGDLSKDGNYWIAPQFVHIPYCIERADSINIKIGSQNCAQEENGAYTGEVSASALSDIEASFVILGHSERRALYHETSDALQKKIQQCLKNNLTVVLCCGETLEQREANKTNEIVLTQLKEALDGIELKDADQMIIAYEPVWAIGTGKTATSDEASAVHNEIRTFLNEQYPALGNEISILYGGSVKPSNIKDLIAKENINGALVGGASLQAESYMQLCDAIH